MFSTLPQILKVIKMFRWSYKANLILEKAIKILQNDDNCGWLDNFNSHCIDSRQVLHLEELIVYVKHPQCIYNNTFGFARLHTWLSRLQPRVPWPHLFSSTIHIDNGIYMWGIPQQIDQAKTFAGFFFSFEYVIDGHKKWLTYTINSLINKKFETNFIPSKTLFVVAQPKQNKKIIWVFLKEVMGHVNHFFNKISSLEHEPLFKIFALLRWFFKGMVTSLYSASPNFQIDDIVKNKKNHRKSGNFE